MQNGLLWITFEILWNDHGSWGSIIMSVAFVGIISLAHEFTSTQVYVIHAHASICILFIRNIPNLQQ